MPKERKQKTNHSWLFTVLFLFWLALFGFGAAFLILTGQPRGSPVTSCWASILTIIWLFAFIIQYRERRGLSTLPGIDFRRKVNDVPKNPSTEYPLNEDAEIIEIPEKPKNNPH
jgi:hypothetical protein